MLIDKNCVVCGNPFRVESYQVQIGRGKCCSHACAAKLSPKRDMSGSNNPNWKNGVKSPKKKPTKEQSLKKTLLYRERHPEKYAANRAVQLAVKSGKLEKKPCEVCGDANSQGHHKDYSRKLDVVWLCQKCHRAVHEGRIEL